MELPLAVRRSARVEAPADQVWAVLNAPDLLARCIDGVEHLRPLPESAGRRYKSTGTLLGQPLDGVLVIDWQSPPTFLGFHLEDWRVAGKSVTVADSNQFWFSLGRAGDATDVELGVGFRPTGRRNELELRALLVLGKRQFDATLRNLSELARTAPTPAPAPVAVTERPPAPLPPPTAPKGPSKKLQVGYFAATLGSRVRHPGVRGTSQLTAKLLERRIAKQAAAAPSVDDARSAITHASTVLDAISGHLREPVPPHLAVLHQAFGEKILGLRRDALQYAMGASHVGYVVRQIEEELVAELPALDEASDLLASEWRDASLSDVQVVHRLASNYAQRSTVYGWQLDVMALPWNPPEQRRVWRETSLQALTNPGATFTRRPRGIDDDQTQQCWDHGFAMRCCEMSLPNISGRRYTAFKPRRDLRAAG